MLAADVVISEFMARNDTTIQDGFGEYSDWLEIHNSSDSAVDLSGWHLTDDPTDLAKWTFGETVLAAQSRLIVWASDLDRVTGDGEIHTNFKLQADGEYLALVNAADVVVSQYGDSKSSYPSMLADVSLGIDSQGRIRHYLNPTPGLPNDDNSGGVVADTKFSVDRGFFDTAFVVTIRSSTPNATLAYTLDGSIPSPSHGSQVAGGPQGPTVTVPIKATTTLRAMAYLDGWTNTNVDTQTYLFPEQVIRQTGDGLPNTWGHAGADYEMDPAVVDSPLYRDEIADSLTAIPSVSLVTDMDNFFGLGGKGIYPSGQNSPRPVSMEMLFPESGDTVQVEASVEIAGGSSVNRWKSDKLSMQLKFKADLGDAKLRYPIYGDQATDSFDTLILDARLNQAWHYGGGSSPISQRERAQYTRDQFVADLQRELGGHAPHGQWVHLYLNGVYWGIYNLHERPDEHFAQDYLGGEKADYDVIKHNSTVVHGSYRSYQTLLNNVSQNLSIDSRYLEVAKMLDIDQFISYMLVNYYVGNSDWAHQNWYASYNAKSGDGKWRYHSWDAEHVLKELSDDSTGRNDERGPTRVHYQLMQNPTYKLKFMDAVQSMLFHDGALTPTKAAELYQFRLDQVREAVVAESARWGDNQRSQPYTRDVEWQREADRLLNEYFPQRTDRVVQMLRNRGFFHRYDAPAFKQHGGNRDEEFQVAMTTSAGTLYYTTDGSDPRTSNSVLIYDGPITLQQTTTIRTRAKRGTSEWSAVSEATFQVLTKGDFSGNGTLDTADLDDLTTAIAEANYDSSFDLDGNSQVNSEDVDYWLVELAGTRRGDVDLDGNIDFADFLVLSKNFGQQDSNWSDGDANGDRNVDFADFLLLSSNFGWHREEN